LEVTTHLHLHLLFVFVLEVLGASWQGEFKNTTEVQGGGTKNFLQKGHVNDSSLIQCQKLFAKKPRIERN
jgi:hypothetical protein